MTTAYVTGNPAGRVLTLLERVQERPGITGPRLAADLGVTERTVRRYVATLQGLGIPVEPTRGRIGGYRLRAGYRMPPLMLSTDEAVAVTLALAVMNHTDRTSGTDDSTPVETALAKLRRVLPREVAGRVDDVLSAVTRPQDGWTVVGPAPDPSVLAALAAGVVGRQRCRLRHRAQHGDVTVREVNPYGVAVVQGGRGW
jgi:predicted DNA-binding transcriptional regulator YafY